MNNTQKWLLIGAIWTIAISLFMIGLQRYTPTNDVGLLDKWTGIIFVRNPQKVKSSILSEPIQQKSTTNWDEILDKK